MRKIVKRKTAGPALLTLLALWLCAGALPVLAQEAAESWLPVTIVYNGDVQGKIEPCG
jgi:hypothetical protein